MRTGRTPPALVVLLMSLFAALAACGVSAQDTSEAVTTGVTPSSEPGDGGSSSGPRLTAYFVRDADLAAVERRISTATAEAALEQVVEGPTRAEAADGIRTALAPAVDGVQAVGPDGIATVTVSRGFAGITGGNQLLAVAQIVWTLTELQAVEGVRFALDGSPVEVPTDAGLSSGPVDRDDFRSVAPADPTPGTEATGTPATGTRVGPPGTPTGPAAPPS